MSITPTWSGEVQLAGWSETHTGGCKITFWLPESTDLDAFRALTVRKGNAAGHRMMCVLVEIGDDEQPVQPVCTSPEPVQKTPESEHVEPKGGSLAKSAGILCATPEFQQFAQEQGDGAANLVRNFCGVTSRRHLDHDDKAAVRFARLMAQYRDWLANETETA